MNIKKVGITDLFCVKRCVLGLLYFNSDYFVRSSSVEILKKFAISTI